MKKLLGLIVGFLVLIPTSSAFADNPTKHIEVDLTQQRLYAYDGSQLIYNFPVSTGKASLAVLPGQSTLTPTGTFRVYVKLLSTRMTGGDKLRGTFYDLTGVPYTMYFYQGFGIHGAYWHNNFGHPMSHGCVNLPVEDSRLLYLWSPDNVPIHIYGVTPVY